MKNGRIFVSSLLAGICVSLGGIAYLSTENKLAAAAIFTVGLFVICTMGFHIYTGKACYLLDNDRSYALTIPLIWLGNLVGTGISAAAVRLTRIAFIAEKARALCQVKLDDSYASLFILGIICNIFIYIAVESFKSNPHELGKYLALFFGVMGFILCGAEHCVADMFYFWVAGIVSVKALLCLLVVSLGNLTGSLIFPLLRRLV